MRPSVSYAILCDGDFPGKAEVRDCLLSCDVVVCCDGAAASFMRFRRPEFVVGDMDSLPEDVRAEAEPSDRGDRLDYQCGTDTQSGARSGSEAGSSRPPAYGRSGPGT